MMRRGFSLIEILIALTIASILAILLYSSLDQAGLWLKRVEGVTGTDIAIGTFYDRFERDIAGAFIPPIGDPDRADRAFAQHLKQVQEQEDKKQQQPPDKKDTQQKAPPVKNVSLKDIQVKNVFVYQAQDNNLKELSFITNNPACAYGNHKPHIVRVTYTLERESGKSTYTLKRQESAKLGPKFVRKERAYQLLNHIVSLKLDFRAPQPVEKEKTAKPQDSSEQKTAAPLITFDSWPPEQKKSETDAIRDLPQFVHVYLTYQNPVDEQIKKYEFSYQIKCYRAPSQAILNVNLIHEQRTEEQKKIDEQKTQQPQQQPSAQDKKS